MELGLKDRLPQAKSLGFAVTVELRRGSEGGWERPHFRSPPPKQILSPPLSIRLWQNTRTWREAQRCDSCHLCGPALILWHSCHPHCQAVLLSSG